jgi:hypothetical protein
MREVGGSSPSSPIARISQSQQHLRAVGIFVFQGGLTAWCQWWCQIGSVANNSPAPKESRAVVDACSRGPN